MCLSNILSNENKTKRFVWCQNWMLVWQGIMGVTLSHTLSGKKSIYKYYQKKKLENTKETFLYFSLSMPPQDIKQKSVTISPSLYLNFILTYEKQEKVSARCFSPIQCTVPECLLPLLLLLSLSPSLILFWCLKIIVALHQEVWVAAQLDGQLVVILIHVTYSDNHHSGNIQVLGVLSWHCLYHIHLVTLMTLVGGKWWRLFWYNCSVALHCY